MRRRIGGLWGPAAPQHRTSLAPHVFIVDPGDFQWPLLDLQRPADLCAEQSRRFDAAAVLDAIIHQYINAYSRWCWCRRR